MELLANTNRTGIHGGSDLARETGLVPEPRKYDRETRERAVRLYQERRRAFPDESDLASRRRVGELIVVPHGTLRGWVTQVEVDTGVRPGVSSDASGELVRLGRENAELRRANGTFKTASAFFAAAELDRPLR
jgi:transposase